MSEAFETFKSGDTGGSGKGGDGSGKGGDGGGEGGEGGRERVYHLETRAMSYLKLAKIFLGAQPKFTEALPELQALLDKTVRAEKQVPQTFQIHLVFQDATLSGVNVSFNLEEEQWFFRLAVKMRGKWLTSFVCLLRSVLGGDSPIQVDGQEWTMDRLLIHLLNL